RQHGPEPDSGVAAGACRPGAGDLAVCAAQRWDVVVGAAQDRCVSGPAWLAAVQSAPGRRLCCAGSGGAVAGARCGAVVRLGLAAEGVGDDRAGAGRYRRVCGCAGRDGHADAAFAAVGFMWPPRAPEPIAPRSGLPPHRPMTPPPVTLYTWPL